MSKATSIGADDAKGKGKNKAEPEAKRGSFKDRMRRKEKKKPDAPSKFVPVVFDDDENLEVETKPELQDMKSPTRMREANIQTPSAEDNQSAIPMPSILEGTRTVGPPKSHESLPQGMTKSGDGLLRSQLPSMASISESEPERTRMMANDDVYTRPVPAVAEDHSMFQEEEQATVASVDKAPTALEVPGPESSPLINHLTEQLDEAVSRPQPQTEVHSGQDTKIVPNLVPKKHRQSNIPTSTRVTRSALKPFVPPPPKQTRRKHVLIAFTFFDADHTSGQRAHTTNSILGRRATSVDAFGPQVLSPSSPMQTGSLLGTPPRNFRTPGSSPAKISLAKTLSKPDFSTEGSPSPTKIAKAVSMFSRATGKSRH